MHPALRSFREELSATLVRICAYVGGLFMLAVFGMRMLGAPVVEAAIEPAARPEWSGVERPFRAFALTIPELPEAEPDYALRRHAGGGRKDIMTWGAPDSPGSRLMLEIYRPGTEIRHFSNPESEAAARTADLGGPYALKPAVPIHSKFGPIASFDFTASADGRKRQCLGFARGFAEPRLQIAGWYCKGGVELVERGLLTCAFDRLALIGGASEPKLQELFAHAELKRQFCAQKSLTRGASSLTRLDWINASKGPKLRGRVVAR